MTKDLDTLSPEELGRLFPIILSAPDPEWPNLFRREKARIVSLLGEERAIRVEHIGSTAVPGLMAKPTIDILVEIPPGEEVKEAIIAIMAAQGYIHMRDQTDHLMVVKGYTPRGFQGQCYHIHMAPGDHDGLWDRICFRECLRQDPRLARAYERLKARLASVHRYDREAYTEAKGDFILSVIRTAKKWFQS